MMKLFLFCGVLSLSSIASAEEDADNFIGPLIGVEAGLVQHHFSLEITRPGSPVQIESTKSYAIGAAGFAGYDVKIGSNLIVGAEASLHVGGKAALTTLPPLIARIGIDPKLGYSLTGRIGYAANDKVLLFGRAGYGIHNYSNPDPTNRFPIGNNKSFILGAGAEYRVSKKLAARLDLRHLDNSRNEILVGVLTRF